MFVEDMSVFFSPAEFADEVSLAGVAVRGIFDNSDAVNGGGLGMADTSPKFTLATAAVPASPHGIALVRNGVRYTVADHLPDGTGISVLVLERAT